MKNPRYKYPKTPHLWHSPSVASDDNVLTQAAAESAFLDKRIVVTIKMDGENSTLYSDGLHARSLDSRHHESRSWLKGFHAQIKHLIPTGWRVCGESMYARHSIAYTDLPSYFLIFAVFDKDNNCISWDQTERFAATLGAPTVPVLYRGLGHRKLLHLILPNSLNLQTEEGFVIRTAGSFPYGQFASHVAKWVRPHHVQTDEYWMNQPIVPNGLTKKV